MSYSSKSWNFFFISEKHKVIELFIATFSLKIFTYAAISESVKLLETFLDAML